MIKLGNQEITLKVGSNDVSAAYLGSTLVYSGGTPPTPSFDGKWLATYTGGTTSSAECDASSAITSGEITLTDLVSVEIGQCVTTISATTFKNCSGLTSVTLGSGLTTIGTQAFNNCTSLSSITIPNTVTSIDDYAFYKCSGLTSITIPNSVISIGESAFGGCSDLTSITIPSGVTSIGNRTFQNCSGLTSVTIGNGVTDIQVEAFRQCTSLTSINIPSGVTLINNQAFRRCTSLTSIICLAQTPPTLGSRVFDETNNCPIYVPQASLSDYQSEWADYEDRIQAIGGGENPNSGSNPNIGGIDDEDLPPDN